MTTRIPKGWRGYDVETRAEADALRDRVLSALDPGLQFGVRAERARMFGEQVADLRDVAQLAAGVIGGSAAMDAARMHRPDPRNPREAAEAQDRQQARTLAAELWTQLRAVNTLTDTPGLNSRPFEPGTATTGLGDGMPLIREWALDRPFTGGGSAPVTPGLAGGAGLDGLVDPDGTTDTALAITDVGAAESRHHAAAIAKFAHQVRDWTDDTGLRMLDQLLLDIADRAAEKFVAQRLIAAAGGTRVAGADLTTLGTAIDAAEAAAAGALNAPAGLLIVNPVNWPKVRRAVAQSWQAGLPQPAVAVSAGCTAGTLVVTGRDAMHLFRDSAFFLARDVPSTIEIDIAAVRPFYAAIRKATGVQTVTGIA